MKAYLPDQIQSALDLANICVYVFHMINSMAYQVHERVWTSSSAAQESETAFLGIQNLARELVIACTNQVRSSPAKGTELAD